MNIIGHAVLEHDAFIDGIEYIAGSEFDICQENSTVYWRAVVGKSRVVNDYVRVDRRCKELQKQVAKFEGAYAIEVSAEDASDINSIRFYPTFKNKWYASSTSAYAHVSYKTEQRAVAYLLKEGAKLKK